MIINAGNLSSLYVAFKAAFQGGLGQAAPQYDQVATTVPSATSSEEYGWLGQLPGMREWIGDRVLNGISTSGYTIKNKDYELTVAVERPKIEDDQYGIYTPLFTEMGRATAAHPDQQVFDLLGKGDSTLCYDGQNFFDTDHPVLDANGAVQSQSNFDNNAGAGTRWYLLDTSRALKPVIYQQRKAPNFVALDRETDPNVFMKREFLYGVDGRSNVGFGFWQMAYCSRKDLTEDNFTAAFTAMTSRTGDNGRPLGIRPNVLLVPSSLEIAADKLLTAIYNANGASNVLAGKCKVMTSPWLG